LLSGITAHPARLRVAVLHSLLLRSKLSARWNYHPGQHRKGDQMFLDSVLRQFFGPDGPKLKIAAARFIRKLASRGIDHALSPIIGFDEKGMARCWAIPMLKGQRFRGSYSEWGAHTPARL
jgi:hypothetical protein